MRRMRASPRLLIALTACCSLGCGKRQPADTIPRPTSLPTQAFTGEKAKGFDEQLRKQYGLGPETTWAGYSFAFTVDLPQDAQRRLQSSFVMPSGARAHFILLDPVDYVITRGE